MAYNFLNTAWLIGLVGCVPFAMLLSDSKVTNALLTIQFICMSIALGNILWGLYLTMYVY